MSLTSDNGSVRKGRDYVKSNGQVNQHEDTAQWCTSRIGHCNSNLEKLNGTEQIQVDLYPGRGELLCLEKDLGWPSLSSANLF